ncbi:MAG TPA: serine/threonine-protein kinase [Gemmatimonadales bacterium]
MPPSITPHDWQRLAPLIDALLDAGPDRRASLLDELSAGDPGRRAELARLVEECERPDPLLDRPAAEAFAALLGDEGIPVPETLAQRYRIVRELGRGGMAVVYLAGDLKHGREVAVKVVRPEVAVVLGRDRFLREIAIAARLHHANIVPLYDSGEADGFLYYVMPFEPGPSLRERLAHAGGPLPVDEAVRILRDVCEALAHAHQSGIVHCDIKPDNVLLAGRHALVTDFGVARALAEAGGDGSPRTGAGITLGTPTYMAPEQIGPHPRVDHRADIYAVGLLAYELLAGQPPFHGETSHEVLAAHLAEPPPPIALRRPELPSSLAELVMRCLEKRPEDRWQQADQLVRRLEELALPGGGPAVRAPRRTRALRTGVVAGLIGVALVGVWAWYRHENRPSAAARELFIVADFVNRTSDTTLGPLIAEVIRDELAGSPGLALLSRERIAETRRRMRLAPDLPLTADVAREVATREEIKAVVEGTVSAAGRGFALSARIIEAASGDVIHAATAMARDSTDITAAIERLSRGLRAGLGEPLAPIPVPTGALWSYTTRSLPALEKVQLAMMPRAAGDYLRAIEVNREAIALDPDFAIAHVAVASNTAFAGLPTGPLVPVLLRAFRIADSLPDRERSAVEGFYHWYVTGDLTRSIAAFQRQLEALKATPREAGFVAEAATALMLNGDAVSAERVVREVKSAMERGGGNWPAGRSSGGVQLIHVQVLHALGSDAEAARILGEYIRRRPESMRGLHLRIGFLADSGRYEAVHALAARIRRQSALRNDLRVQAEADAVRGRLGEAVGHLRDLRDQALALQHPEAAVEIAAAAARLRLLAVDSGGVSEVDDLLARQPVDSLDVFSRPYLPLALFYAHAGLPARARAWLRRYELEFPSEFRGPDRWMLHRARAATFAAEGDARRALAEHLEAARLPALRVGIFEEPFIRLSDHPERARLYRRLGEPDSALAVYRRYLAARSLTRIALDAFERGQALEAMGALYEQRGDRRLAAAAFGDFAELWREADARLQPRVEAARRQASALSRN